jgi:hypothetical protein
MQRRKRAKMARINPRHFLIIWGTAVHAIRSGDGTPLEAAHEAFGVRPNEIRALKTMTWVPVTTALMRSDLQRTKICVDLLEAHKSRAAAVAAGDSGGPDALVATIQEAIDKLVHDWKPEWDRYERRYKLPVIPCLFFNGSEFREVR